MILTDVYELDEYTKVNPYHSKIVENNKLQH